MADIKQDFLSLNYSASFPIQGMEEAEDLFFARILFGEFKICTDGIIKNVRIVGNRGKARIVCRARNALYLISADKNIAFVGAARTYQEIDNRALSAAALADDRRHTLFGESHGYIF